MDSGTVYDHESFSVSVYVSEFIATTTTLPTYQLPTLTSKTMSAITASSKFGGWAGIDEKAAQGGMKYVEFEPKPWDEDDVDG